MTRDSYMEMQTEALKSLRADVENRRRELALQGFVNEELERGYEAILRRQQEWETNGFWTKENLDRYREMYKRMN